MYKRTLLMLVCCTLPLLKVAAQQFSEKQAKEYRVSFRLGNDLLLKDYKDNARQLDSLSCFLKADDTIRIDSLVFIGSSSPEGGSTLNTKLALRRARNMRGYLEWIFPYTEDIPSRLIATTGSWSEVIEEIKNDHLVPNRQAVIALLEKYSNDPMVMERVRIRYKDAYLYIHRNMLSDKRNVTACLIYCSSQRTIALVVQPSVETPSVGITISDLNDATKTDTLTMTDSLPATDVLLVQPVTHLDINSVRRPFLALKTDLLLWGGVLPNFKMGTWTPNLSVEFYFARCWSVQAGGIFANWDALGGSKELFALSAADVEVRLWLGKASAYRGLFIGAFGQYGEYDVQQGMQVSSLGNTGNFRGAGIGLGWLLPFGRGWAVEGEVRSGWRSATNKVYEAENAHYFYESQDKENVFDVQFRLSMVYRFGTNKSR